MYLMGGEKSCIIELITSVSLGGAENVAFSLAEDCEDDSRSFNYIIAELYPTINNYADEKRSKLKTLGIKIKTLYNGSKRMSLLFAPFSLFNLIRYEKPAIIHSHTDLPDFVLATTIYLCRIFQVKTPRVVRTVHNTELWPTHNIIGKYVEYSFKNDCIIGVSDVALEAYKKLRTRNNLNISSDLHIIYNGCKIPEKEVFNFSIDKQKINILFCGRYEKQKGIDILIQRISEINKVYADQINFYFIGSGSYENHLEQMSKKFENIKLFAPINNIATKLHNMDFLIMPSRFEGLVLLSLEASLARLPVIATKAPGLSETLPDSWPLKFELEDSESLFKLFDNIIKKKYEIEKLKDLAFNFVLKKYSYQNMIEKYYNIYNLNLNR